MALPERYHFSRKLNKCAVMDTPFEEGDLIHTAIFVGFEDDGYLRKDYSEEGWDKRPEKEQSPFSSWQSKWKKPEKIEGDKPLEKETAESLLERLSAEDDPATDNTRYILALMLERSRLLQETESQEVPDGVLRVYRHKKTEAVYIIKDPNLPLDQIVEFQAEVAEMLG